MSAGRVFSMLLALNALVAVFTVGVLMGCRDRSRPRVPDEWVGTGSVPVVCEMARSPTMIPFRCLGSGRAFLCLLTETEDRRVFQCAPIPALPAEQP